MKLTDLYENELDSAYNPEEDVLSRLNIHDKRKPKLTLELLNKIKVSNDARKLEISNRRKIKSHIYGKPKEESGGMNF